MFYYQFFFKISILTIDICDYNCAIPGFSNSNWVKNINHLHILTDEVFFTVPIGYSVAPTSFFNKSFINITNDSSSCRYCYLLSLYEAYFLELAFLFFWVWIPTYVWVLWFTLTIFFTLNAYSGYHLPFLPCT